MLREKHSICRVQYYLQFLASTGCLREEPLTLQISIGEGATILLGNGFQGKNNNAMRSGYLTSLEKTLQILLKKTVPHCVKG